MLDCWSELESTSEVERQLGISSLDLLSKISKQKQLQLLERLINLRMASGMMS
jgi:hypothetical protein